MARGEAATVDGEALFAVELPRNSRQIRPADTVEIWRHVTTVRQNTSFIYVTAERICSQTSLNNPFVQLVVDKNSYRWTSD